MICKIQEKLESTENDSTIFLLFGRHYLKTFSMKDFACLCYADTAAKYSTAFGELLLRTVGTFLTYEILDILWQSYIHLEYIKPNWL